LDGFPAWLAVALLFPVLWIGIGAFLAWVGGWTVLARAYRLAGEFDGRRWRFRSVLVCHRGLARCATYRSSVTLGANARGLSLAVPFFGGHSPVFVP
jgi:hypothetical protein